MHATGGEDSDCDDSGKLQSGCQIAGTRLCGSTPLAIPLPPSKLQRPPPPRRLRCEQRACSTADYRLRQPPVAYSCLLLPTTAYHYLLLFTTTCYPLPLLAIAYHYLLFPTTTCHCLPLLAIA